MEQTITVDGMQYILTYDTPLTEEQITRTISNIRNQSECGCGNKAARLGGVQTLQGYVHAVINMLAPPDPNITDINIGGIDCPSGTCPDAICTSIGCATDTRDIIARYENSGDIPVDIIPILVLTKTSANPDSAIRKGADRLVQTQKNDGTWQWSSPNTNPTDTEYPGTNNTLGVTARGLVKAYMTTGEISYLNAAKKTADLLVSKTPDGFGPDDPGTTGKHKVYGQDITFLVEFADAWAYAGNLNAGTYYSKANDYMAVVLYSPNRFCSGGCSGVAGQLVAYNYNSRTPNLYGWDINGWVEAAVKTGNMAFAQDIVSSMSQYENNLSSTATGIYPTGYSYVLGLAGYLNSYIITGKTPSQYSALKTKLLAELDTDGSFKIYAGTNDGINQTAAYTLMALSITNEDMTGTVDYLISRQSPGGEWIENDGYEYTEEDSEILTALGTAIYTYEIGLQQGVPARAYIDVVFSSVPLRRGQNNVHAGWLLAHFNT